MNEEYKAWKEAHALHEDWLLVIEGAETLDEVRIAVQKAKAAWDAMNKAWNAYLATRSEDNAARNMWEDSR